MSSGTAQSAGEYQFIRMTETGISASGKTKRWNVENKRHGDILGSIQWSGPWRQYVFVPDWQTQFSAGCLRDIASFMEAQR